MRAFLRLPKTSVFRLLLLSAILAGCALPALSQASTGVSGSWVWKSATSKNKSQTQFRLVIRRDGKEFKGTYSVDEFINGEWQGEDGNQTPFVGRMRDSEVQLEFDPAATHPGYEENVSYLAPTEGRKPSFAVIAVAGAKLRWRLTSGDAIEHVPAKLFLSRERGRGRGRGR